MSVYQNRDFCFDSFGVKFGFVCIDLGGKMESGQNSNLSKSESLANGHVASGCSLDVGLERNSSIEPVDQPVKYKRRNVSAVRDFPPGCGRFAPRIDAGKKDTNGPGGSAGVHLEPKSNRLEKSSDGVESPKSSKTLLPEALELARVPDKLCVVDGPENLKSGKIDSAGHSEAGSHSESCSHLEAKSNEFPKSSDRVEFPNSSKGVLPESVKVSKVPDKMRMVDELENLKSETLEPIKISNHMGMLKPSSPVESTRTLDQTAALDVMDRSTQLEQKEMPGISGQVEYLQSQTSSVCTAPSDSLKSLPEIQLSNAVTKAFEEFPFNKYPPRRKISAVRDFPLGCGINAPPITKEGDGKGFLDFPPCGGSISEIMEDGQMKSVSPSGVKGVDGEQWPGHNGSSNRMVREEIDGKLQVKSPSTAFEEETREINNNALVLIPSGNKLKGVGSREVTEDSDMVTPCEIVSINNRRGDYSNETTCDVDISTTYETASNCKLKGGDLKEKTGEAQTRSVHAAIFRGKSKEVVTKKNKEEDHIKVSHGSEFRFKSKVKRKEIIGDVQNKAAHKTVSANKLKGVVTKEFSQKLQNRTAHEIKSYQLDSSSSSSIRNTNREIAVSGVKVSKELANKDNSSGSKILGEAEEQNKAGNEAQQEDPTVLNIPTDRVIVLALPAAGRSPWEQGKRLSKKMLTTNRSSLGGNKLSTVSKRKEGGSSTWNSGSSEGRVVNKNSPPRGSTTSHRDGAIVAYDEDALSNVGAKDNKSIFSGQELSVNLTPFGLLSSNDRSARNEVRQALRLFQTICRKLLRNEETKPKVPGQIGIRVDTAAYKLLKEKNKFVNNGECILGSVPGVEIGDEFYYRAELAIIGLHRHLQSGIDYTKKGGMVVATSIVASGDQDEMDGTDVLYYIGQGGNPGGEDMQPEHQKLERGNLALKNSIESQMPVRVVRGFRESRGNISLGPRKKATSTFVYDGLYLVEDYEQVDEGHGFLVFKYRLRRIQGQPEIPVKEVKQSKKLKDRKGLCVVDISEGKEKIQIGAVNTIDSELPPPFNYTTKMIYPSWYNPNPPAGCDCTAGCLDSERCICSVRNGGEIPFNSDGAIVEAKSLVYECGPSCKCPPSCHNRVSQHGITIPLEIFKTKTRGWGVRALSSIPSGSFICEYVGELLKEVEAEKRTGNDEYLFDIGQNYNDQLLRDDVSNLLLKSQSDVLGEVSEDAGFTIDAAQYGNVGRFINHSCSPNLYAQDVLYDHGDKRMPHVMFFAAENIPPLQELTYHYNYTIDHVHDSNGNIRSKDCYCGSHECTGRLY